MSTPDRIGAVILAAGDGTRMGGPKLKAVLGNGTFLDAVLRSLAEAGIRSIRCVVRPDEELWMRSNHPDIAYVINPDPSEGMISSVRRGIEELTDVDGIFLTPVDHPLVRAETYRRLMAAFSAGKPAFCKPMFNGVPGHPILVPRAFVQEVLDAPDDATLHTLIQSSSMPQRRIECDDPGILKNMNRPADLVGHDGGPVQR